jgi:predicted nucleotidyltransferase
MYFSYLGGLPSNINVNKILYLEAHASNALSSALSAEIEDEIEIEYSWPEKANLLWKMLEQMYDLSNRQRSSSSVPENISSSSINIDLGQEEQSCTQEEKVEFASLKKPDCLVS